MKNLGNMLKQAQELQGRMAEMQAKLDEIEMAGSAGGGMVTVTLNGKGEMRQIKIDTSLDRSRRRSRSWRTCRRGVQRRQGARSRPTSRRR